jgi:putative effector of murein hydrolase
MIQGYQPGVIGYATRNWFLAVIVFQIVWKMNKLENNWKRWLKLYLVSTILSGIPIKILNDSFSNYSEDSIFIFTIIFTSLICFIVVKLAIWLTKRRAERSA